MTTDIATKSKVTIAPKNDLAPPPRFQVIMFNDNVTTIDFVMAVLQEVFEHNEKSAENLTSKIHNEGQAIVAVLPFEIAESKAVDVTLLARNNNFPLTVKIEPES